MKQIVALCDYQGRFGSKYFDKPYRSGMDKDLLKTAFLSHGVNIEFLSMADTKLIGKSCGKHIIYTSQEDHNYAYKSFIEDIVLGLEISGAHLMPKYKYLRANNNKVFMEILRKTMLPDKYQIDTKWYGTAEEALTNIESIKFPRVIKSAAGAGSHGVKLAMGKDDFVAQIKKVSRLYNLKSEAKDRARAIKHQGYVRESIYRNKFIVQDFIPDLSNDWKVLVFDKKYYVLRRHNRPGDFRASGSGLFSFDDEVNPSLLDAAKEIKEAFDVPLISLDLAISEDRIVLIEFQFLYFGTSTLEKSPYYYIFDESEWTQIFDKSVLENEYAASITSCINSNK